MIKYKAKFKEDAIFFEKGITEVQLKDEPNEIYIVMDELVSGKVWIGTKKVQEDSNEIFGYTTQIHLDNILSVTNKNTPAMIDQELFKTLEEDLDSINFNREQDIVDTKLEALKKEFSKPVTDKRNEYSVRPPGHYIYDSSKISGANEELPDILTEVFSDNITEKKMEEPKKPQITTEDTTKDTKVKKEEGTNKYNVVELMTSMSNDFSSLTDETKQLLTFLVDYAANKLKEDINK
jgi:hypothetical protein